MQVVNDQKALWFIPECDFNDSLLCQVNLTRMFMEDKLTNYLTETMSISDTIANNQIFNNVSILLFLNKANFLEKKIQMMSIRIGS